LGVTVAGLKVHVPPVGRPLQVKLTACEKPPAGVTVIVVCTDPPEDAVPLAGEAAMAKLCATACTVTVTAFDVEPEKFVSPA
jgi:hypothetical protein